jgi:single-stranded-DNA-specific exonuclease
MDQDKLINTLLANRGLTKPEEIAEFFHPTTPDQIVSPFNSDPAIRLIKSHIKKGNKIAIYGDYDVDGICSTAILWETLYGQYKNVLPHIPHRESEGYGLSTKGIDHCLQQGAKLIIAVDNGIVAHSEIKYCQAKDCDIIIIDHHEPGKSLPTPNVLLHSTSTCAAALAWLFCRDFCGAANIEQLSLVSIAVICDIVPLLGLNRSFAKYGLQELNRTSRPGLSELFKEAAIQTGNLGPYEVGFVIGPRLNAMGRLEHDIDSMRLLCTKDSHKAVELALMLGETNKARQELTTSSVSHALAHVNLDNSIIISADPSYSQGIIGLIAAKLVEKYYRPAIAIAVGEAESKASARSIPGFHITDHIRASSHLLMAAGGHAMAAGFTVETSKLEELTKVLSQVKISEDLLVKKTRVDAQIPISDVNYALFNKLKQFEPFGSGNPKPIFESRNVVIDDIKKVGKLQQHSKLTINGLEAMAFNQPDIPPSPVNIVYSLDENTWNGHTKLQLVVKDIQPI